MYEYAVVEVSVQVSGAAKRYPYHELRLVRKLVGGGHYAHSIGCTIIRRSGPRRGTKSLRASYQQQCDVLNAELRAQQQREADETVARYAGSYALSALPPAVSGHAHLALSR